jgi:tetratricopeptide (TPR) repeat protein
MRCIYSFLVNHIYQFNLLYDILDKRILIVFYASLEAAYFGKIAYIFTKACSTKATKGIRISSALLDFQKIEDKGIGDKLKARRFNLMGICYFHLGKLYDNEAESAYHSAIKYDSKLASAYYNLAVLFYRKNDQGKAKELLEDCLETNTACRDCAEAKQRLESSGGSDWYNWWFGRGRGKKVIGIALIINLLRN